MDPEYSIQLRFYEDKGLVAPARRGSRRLYSDRDRTRLKLALRGRRLGFSLEECREIIDMYDPSAAGGARQLLRLCDKIREHRAALLDKLRDIEATLATMNEVEARCLAELLGRTSADSPRN
jgi:DNA-binding transcriptional MerR regulator